MRLELALMFFHYLNRRRNSNPSPTSTTNPTKNPRSPPPSSSNSSFIPYHPRHQLEKHSVRPSISINPGRGIPTPPTLVSSPFGGMKGPPFSLHRKLASWSNADAYRAHNVALLATNGANLSLSLRSRGWNSSSRRKIRTNPMTKRRLVISRPRTASISLQLPPLFKRVIRSGLRATSAAPRAIVTKGDLCPKGGLFDLWFRKVSFQKKERRFQPVTTVKDTECLCYPRVIFRS